MKEMGCKIRVWEEHVVMVDAASRSGSPKQLLLYYSIGPLYQTLISIIKRI